jgi:hypothetical protein
MRLTGEWVINLLPAPASGWRFAVQ